LRRTWGEGLPCATPPMAQNSGSKCAVESQNNASKPSISILLADDDKDALEFLANIFPLKNHDVALYITTSLQVKANENSQRPQLQAI
jgi:hypothetical protein